jgi:SAM-dependent methyltransferase
MAEKYEFSVDWFSSYFANWKNVTSGQVISKILEIGPFEGRSTCTMIEAFGAKAPLFIHSVDDWAGRSGPQKLDMAAAEARFDRNVAIAARQSPHPVECRKHKGRSFDMLVRILAEGHRDSFDLVFVDGSHQAPDVLEDLILCYELCKPGGIIICDDYLWSTEPAGRQDPLNMPKPAIDAFSTIFMRKIAQIGAPLYQVYFRKLATAATPNRPARQSVAMPGTTPAGSRAAGTEDPLLEQLVRAMYRVLLSVEPDPLGVNAYVEEMRSGMSMEYVLRDFLRSGESAGTRQRLPEDADAVHGGRAALDDAENLLLAQPGSRASVRDDSKRDMDRAARLFFDAGAGPKDIATLLRFYVDGVGATAHMIRERVRSTLERRLHEADGSTGASAIFRNRTHLRENVIERHYPALLKSVFAEADTGELETSEIFPASRNALYDPSWPFPFKTGIGHENRPALRLLAAREADVHVHPSYSVVYHRGGQSGWASANLQGLGNFVVAAPLVHLEGSVVIVQDYFTGGNLAHFLFDAMTRLGHFCRVAEARVGESTFVFGGVPSEFHGVILEAAMRRFGLDRQRCFFPRRGINIRASRSIYWFSDQADIMHPAQYMHPLSVEILRGLGDGMGLASAEPLRIYVSRGDVGSRRLANEAELTPHLAKLGFKSVRLADMPVREQIACMTGAECVVAPHGMGLVHLALHQGAPALVELFHPVVGTAAYALLARACGFPYRSLAGVEVDANSRSFSVDVGAVLDALRDLGVT